MQFVNSLPPKFNVALVTFAGTATTVVPPTLDRGAVTAAIDALRPQPSTAIGEGIYTSLAALTQVPPDPDNPNAVVPARIVLLSDGKTQVGRPSDQAARGRPRPERCRSTPSRTAPPTATSRSAAAASPCRSTGPSCSGSPGSPAARRTPPTSAGELKEVYKDIGSSVGKEKVDREVTSRYAGFGLAFAILAALGMISLGARWP